MLEFGTSRPPKFRFQRNFGGWPSPLLPLFEEFPFGLVKSPSCAPIFCTMHVKFIVPTQTNQRGRRCGLKALHDR